MKSRVAAFWKTKPRNGFANIIISIYLKFWRSRFTRLFILALWEPDSGFLHRFQNTGLAISDTFLNLPEVWGKYRCPEIRKISAIPFFETKNLNNDEKFLAPAGGFRIRHPVCNFGTRIIICPYTAKNFVQFCETDDEFEPFFLFEFSFAQIWNFHFAKNANSGVFFSFSK